MSQALSPIVSLLWQRLLRVLWPLCLALAVALPGATDLSAAGPPLPQRVVVACSVDSAPFHFIDEAGQPDGMFVDLWRLFAQKAGIEVEFRCAPWAETLAMMKQGGADIHAGLFYTDERDAYLDYAGALFKAETHFFYHESILGLERLEDLLGFRIGVLEGDFAVEFVTQHLPGATLVPYRDYEALFAAAEKGEIRVFVIDTLTSLYHLSRRDLLQHFRYNVAKPLYSRSFFAAVQQGDGSLQEAVRQGMESIGREERAEIERRWFGTATFKTPDVLVVTHSYKYPPFTLLDSEGRPAGMFVDLWRLWAEKTGRRIEFLTSDWAGTLRALENGDADIHFGLFRSPSRMETMDFSQPYYQVPTSLFYPRRTRAFATFEELSGHRVGTVRGSYQAEYLRKFIPAAEVVEFSTNEAMVMAASKGEIDAFIGETPVISSVLGRLGKTGDFSLLGETLFTEKFHAAVKKGNADLLKLLDQGFSAITRGELAEIERRYVLDPQMRQMDRPMMRLTAAEEAWLAEHRQLRLGIDPGWPPFEFRDAEGSYAGIAADYVDLLGRRLEVGMTPLPGLSWEQVLEKARAKELDVIPAIVASPQRREYLAFTAPYLEFPLVIVARNSVPFIAGLPDLLGKKVAIVQGYVVEDFLKRDFPRLSLQPAADVDAGLKAVSSGEAYAFIGNLAAVSYAIRKEGLTNLKVAGSTPYSYDLSFAVRKDWAPLVPIIEKALQSLTAEEKNAIYNKWVSLRFEHGTDWSYLWPRVALGAGGVLAILAVVVIWNRRLSREVAERKRAETELARYQAHLEELVGQRTAELKEAGDKIGAILKSVPHGLLVTDMEQRIVLMNRAAESLLGSPLKEMFGRPLQAAVESPPVHDHVARLLAEGGPAGLLEVELFDRDRNEVRSYQVGTSWVRSAEGVTSGLIVVLRDVTLEREAERLKNEFITTAAHEIGTPLTAMIGYAELLLGQGEAAFEKDQEKEYLATIVAKGERLATIVDELLQLSRLEVGRPLRLELGPCALDGAIREAVADHRRESPARRFELSLPDEAMEIAADGRRVAQVLDNLLSNAVKFSPPRGTVRVSACMEGDEVRVAVEDEGEGMTPEQVERAFEKFYRGDTSMTAVGGFGLGLTIARQIVEAHGGRIWIESPAKQGTRVVFTLPAKGP